MKGVAYIVSEQKQPTHKTMCKKCGGVFIPADTPGEDTDYYVCPTCHTKQSKWQVLLSKSIVGEIKSRSCFCFNHWISGDTMEEIEAQITDSEMTMDSLMVVDTQSIDSIMLFAENMPMAIGHSMVFNEVDLDIIGICIFICGSERYAAFMCEANQPLFDTGEKNN